MMTDKEKVKVIQAQIDGKEVQFRVRKGGNGNENEGRNVHWFGYEWHDAKDGTSCNGKHAFNFIAYEYRATEKKEAVAESVAGDIKSKLRTAITGWGWTYNYRGNSEHQAALNALIDFAFDRQPFKDSNPIKEQRAVSGLRDVQGPTELLPCPFDGKPATSCFMPSGVPGMEDCGYWACGCARCSGASQAIEFHGDSKEEVEFLWNKRAASSVPEGPKSFNGSE